MFLARCRFGILNTRDEAPRNDLPTTLPQFIGLPGPLKNNNYDGDNCYLCRRSNLSPMFPLARNCGSAVGAIRGDTEVTEVAPWVPFVVISQMRRPENRANLFGARFHAASNLAELRSNSAGCPLTREICW